MPRLVPGSPSAKRILTGEQATVAALAATANPRILHLATHGYFLGDDVPTGHVLQRSGLAFAGANHAKEFPAGADGLLSAYEVSALDLRATELVVLSACETALGDIRAGEGVFGLRRAFAIAGAGSLMMSLWPVGDEITAQQIGIFYRLWPQLGAAEALRRAQLETIKSLKADQGVAPAFLWAPFILQGAPTPLDSGRTDVEPKRP